MAFTELIDAIRCGDTERTCIELHTNKIYTHKKYSTRNVIREQLYNAVIADNDTIVELLLETGIKCTFRIDRKCNTLLHVVKSSEVAAILLRHGVNVNASNSYGETPLHTAVHHSILWELIQHGGNVIKKTHRGGVPLHYAKTGNTISLLERFGASIQSVDNIGNTALHYASDPGVIDRLLQMGAFINAKNKYGETPLHLVQTISVAIILMKLGADVFEFNNKMQRPHQYADSDELHDVLYNELERRHKLLCLYHVSELSLEYLQLQNDSCLICKKSLKFGSNIMISVLACMHMYHGICINNILLKNPAKPLCIVCNPLSNHM